MTGLAKKILLFSAVCAGAHLLAFSGQAWAQGDGLDACRKWNGEGAGLQYKCFDCLKLVGSGPNERWVNTCPEYPADEGRRPFWTDPTYR